MDLLQIFEDAVDGTVHVVVHRLLLDFREGVLAQLYGLGGETLLEHLGERLDDVFETLRVVTRRAAIPVIVRGSHDAIDGPAEGGEIGGPTARARGPQEEPFPQPLVLHRLLHDDVNQDVPVLLLEVRPHVVHSNGPRARLRKAVSRLSLQPGQPNRHAVLAEHPVHPKGTITRVVKLVVLDPKPHAVLVRPEDFGRDGPPVLDDAAHVPAAVIPLTPLEISLPRQFEQHVVGQGSFQLRTRSTSPTF